MAKKNFEDKIRSLAKNIDYIKEAKDSKFQASLEAFIMEEYKGEYIPDRVVRAVWKSILQNDKVVENIRKMNVINETLEKDIKNKLKEALSQKNVFEIDRIFKEIVKNFGRNYPDKSHIDLLGKDIEEYPKNSFTLDELVQRLEVFLREVLK